MSSFFRSYSEDPKRDSESQPDPPIDHDTHSYKEQHYASQPDPIFHMNAEKQVAANEKIAKFEAFFNDLNKKAEQINDTHQEEDNYLTYELEADSQAESDYDLPKSLFFSYFIGRCNPPHAGHISAMLSLLGHIKSEKEHGNNAKALILLGSGPKNKNGTKGSYENPLTYEVKLRVLKRLLKEAFMFKRDDELDEICEIQEMTNPFSDVKDFVLRNMKIAGDDIASINISHYAGDKDGDASKLEKVLTSTSNAATSRSEAQVSTATVALPAAESSGEAMSATRIRNDAYTGINKTDWMKKYEDFYGKEDAESVYNSIIDYKGYYEDKNAKRANPATASTSSTSTKKSRKGGKRTINKKHSKKNKKTKKPTRKIKSKRVRKTRKIFGGSIINYKNGDIYDGEVNVSSQPHGDGKMTYANGDIYDGEWVNYMKEGDGKMTYANGNFYNGQWVNDKKNGYGKMTYANDKKNEDGTLTYKNGDIYDGDWVDDIKKGNGKMTYATGDIYDGQWVNDMKEGDGKMTYATGNKYDGVFYDGEWVNDMKSGHGKMTLEADKIYRGYWENDIKKGEGEMTDEDGNTIYDNDDDNDDN